MIPISVTKNEDLLPVEPNKRTWRGYNYVALCVYRPTLQHETWPIDATSSSQLGRRHVQHQYVSFILYYSSSSNPTRQLDDSIVNDTARHVVVARVDLCVARVQPGHAFPRFERTSRCCVPYYIPRR